MEEQKDNDILGSEIRRQIQLLRLTQPALAQEKGWDSTKAFVRQAVIAQLNQYIGKQ